jgi:hypothetical protein
MKIFCTSITLLLLSILVGCSDNKKASQVRDAINISTTNRAVLSSEIVWEKLNPARGDQSPQAGTIWGNRKGQVATGFLAKFVDGFSSPPHIHNVTYRAIVVDGLVHNDDPVAGRMWMPTGSFWTQPAGQSHITASKGQSIAYVEIDSGPYLVQPIDDNFDNGESPINISSDNITWLDSQQVRMIDNDSAEMAFLWDDNDMNGRLLKIKKGFNGKIYHEGNIFHAVVIQGELNYDAISNNILDAGSYFTSTEPSQHKVKANSSSECIIYVRTNGKVWVE